MSNNPLEAVKSSRAVHTYTLPERLHPSIKTVGLVELTPVEELMATKRSGSDGIRLAYELAKQALAEINGAPVRLADGSSDTAWESMGAKVRNLVLGAYADLHTPPDGAADAFLKSHEVRVG